MSYQPIENYGIIGNMRTVALVGMNGSMDWYCYPHFDSPSIFGAILDDEKGGRFQISADSDGVRHKLLYWPSTNRYPPKPRIDGLPGEEGTFNMCSFWLVEALTRAGQADAEKLNGARLLFERVLGYANHLGLYAEQTGSQGEALGNFPQAFTHLVSTDQRCVQSGPNVGKPGLNHMNL